MTPNFWLNLSLYLLVLLLLAKPLGIYIAQLMEGKLSFVARIEQPIYRLCGVNDKEEMNWLRYALAILLISLVGLLFTYALQRLQSWLPLNPQQLNNVNPDTAFNTALSFVTNTNWQSYAGEATMSYLSQMLALAVQNFLSAATGIVVVIALIRGFIRRSSNSVGNAWVDLTRCTLFLLLPASLLLAIVLISQGVIQNFAPYKPVTTLAATHFEQPKLNHAGEPLIDTTGKPLMQKMVTQSQTLAMGPVASQEAIKMLGTNGGGFFNANSAHPYENPTPLSNFLQMLAIFIIPAALCYTFGRMVGDARQGWTLLATMTLFFVAFAVMANYYEQQGNPLFTQLGVDGTANTLQSGGNMEGKEARFGINASTLFATVTTAASCGAVNSMHDSFTPLGGLVPLFLMQLGEVVFGGAGSGLYGMLMFAILAVFIAGLMIGRTPEYLGKKIESFEIKMTSLAILIPPLLVLTFTALATLTTAGKAGIANPGAHGFSEILYAFTSTANNNGSAFAGLSANTPFYNILLGSAMWLGRFAVIVPVLAIAGSLASKKRLAENAGTMPTHGPLFIGLLIGIVLLIGALNYIPALALGPIVEHLILWSSH